MSAECLHPSTRTPAIFFLLITCSITRATGAAVLPASRHAETSVSHPANQRFSRSADVSETSRKDGDPVGCHADFVEEFFRVLSGPVGKEAEALVAAVIKLLEENDRVNWPALASDDPSLPWPAITSSSSSLPLSDPALRSYAPDDSEKRMAPKFNPSGWRRKRSADAPNESMRRFLHHVLVTYLSELRQGDGTASPSLLSPYTESAGSRRSRGWTDKKRNSLRRVLQRLPEELKPKRKPLEFNPTGW